jgi:hypothetical protein
VKSRVPLTRFRAEVTRGYPADDRFSSSVLRGAVARSWRPRLGGPSSQTTMLARESRRRCPTFTSRDPVTMLKSLSRHSCQTGERRTCRRARTSRSRRGVAALAGLGSRSVFSLAHSPSLAAVARQASMTVCDAGSNLRPLGIKRASCVTGVTCRNRVERVIKSCSGRPQALVTSPHLATMKPGGGECPSSPPWPQGG